MKGEWRTLAASPRRWHSREELKDTGWLQPGIEAAGQRIRADTIRGRGNGITSREDKAHIRRCWRFIFDKHRIDFFGI
jgi:hypothetical protein